jgi:nicotinamide-nucleotide amidase
VPFGTDPFTSAVLKAGWVTYSNEAKAQFLGVPTELIRQFGAVSEPVAIAMAEGATRLSHTAYALAVTGIAGPGGGTEDKPVGTVFIALATPRGTVARKFLNRLDRESFKQATAQQALDLLRRELLHET